MYNLRYTKGEGDNAISKSLYECTTEEALDLKNILFGKYQKLASIGKPTAMQFLKMMQVVDEYLIGIQTQLTLKEMTKTVEEVKPDVKDSGNHGKKRHNRNPWTPGTNPIT